MTKWMVRGVSNFGEEDFREFTLPPRLPHAAAQKQCDDMNRDRGKYCETFYKPVRAPFTLPAMTIETNLTGGVVIVAKDVPAELIQRYDPEREAWVITMVLT